MPSIGLLTRTTLEAIDLLAPLTDSSLQNTLEKLASSQVNISASLEHFIAGFGGDSEVVEGGLIAAAKFGNMRLLQILKLYPLSFGAPKLSIMLQNAIESDCPETCQAIISLYQLHHQQVSKDLVRLATKRGNRQIRKVVLQCNYN